MKYWSGAHSDAEAAQLQQGATTLINLALGDGGRNIDGNAAMINPQLRLEQGGEDMDIEDQVNTDADAGNMQS
jgi:hypothetical protein